MKRTIWALLLGFFVATAHAEWTLDFSQSSIHFISIKKTDIAEVHSFKEASGTIDDQGDARVVIRLDSVETLIPIRNERMREFLFETTNYAEAVLSARIDPVFLTRLEVGGNQPVSAEASLSLHGASQSMVLQMRAARLSDNEIMVASTAPIVLNAETFGLGEGVEKLREIAGLPSISKAVPVNFALTFRQE
jgi:polyisoprenoid-binding protein YceI